MQAAGTPHQATAVSIDGRGIMIEGPPGSGKSSLALALIDRGAVLIGDDGVLLQAEGGRLVASAPPAIAGLLEIRNLGLVTLPFVSAPLSLCLRLDQDAPRFIDRADILTIQGVDLPVVALWPDSAALHLRAEWALRTYGIL